MNTDSSNLERTLIYGLLTVRGAIGVIHRTMRDTPWLTDTAADVFKTALAMHQRDDTVDPATLRAELDKTGRPADRVKLLEAALSQPDISAGLGQVETIAKQIREISHKQTAKKRLLESAKAIEKGDVDGAAREAETALDLLQDRGVEPPKRLGDFLLEARRRMDRRCNKKEKPIETPWPDINAQLGGGLWPGLHVLVSGTGTGKSTWALQLALASAKAGTPVAYIGLELDELQVALRLIGEEAGVSWSRLYTGRPIQTDSYDEVAKAVDAMGALQDLPLHLVTGGPMGWAPAQLDAVAADMRAQYPEESAGSLPMLIVLDFLQIIGKEPTDKARVDLRERIGQAAYLGRRIAPKYNAVVLMISSTARDKYGIVSGDLKEAGLLRDDSGREIRRAIRNPDYLVGLGKESGEIEYASDSVNVLMRVPGEVENIEKRGSTAFIFATPKLRTGPPAWCNLRFNGFRFASSDDGGVEVYNALKPKSKGSGGRVVDEDDDMYG